MANAVSGKHDTPSECNALLEQLSLISLADHHEGSVESVNAGASSSSSCATPMYLNSVDPNHDQSPTPQRRYTTFQEPLPYSSNVHFRTGATSTMYHPNFTTTSSPSYNSAVLNSHNPEGIAFLASHNSIPAGFGATSSTLHNTDHYNATPVYLNGVRDMIGPTPTAFLIQFWMSLFALFRDPSSFYEFACSRPGAKQLESIIKSVGNYQLFIRRLTEGLASIFLELAFNSTGRRVIIQCFQDLGICKRRVLSKKVAQHCLDLATDKSGCILLNACMPYMEATYKDQVLSIIHNHAQFLAQDCYGTYVVQYAVSMEHTRYTPMIVEGLSCIFPRLSTQKEGSHLVEKCISSYLTRRIAVEAFLKMTGAQLQHLACNEFGNFVIQKALLTTMESPVFQPLNGRLQIALWPLVQDLRRSKFGRNVVSKLCIRMQKASHRY